MPLRNTFLAAAFRRSPLHALLCCAMGLGALLPVMLRFDITPFYDWSMYALPQQPRAEYGILELRINDSLVYAPPHTWQDHRRMMVQYTLGHYLSFLRNGDTIPYHTHASRTMHAVFAYNRGASLYNTPAMLSAYPAWLKRYLRQQLRFPIHTIEVDERWLRYDADNHVHAVRRRPLFAL